MAGASYQHGSFIGGEYSKFAQGDTEKPAYRTSMNVCLNGLPTERGTWIRRPGSQFLATSFGGLPARLIPFDFKQVSPYMMEFTNGTLRFFADQVLASTDNGFVVTSISTANPPVATTSSPHGWSTNDEVQFVNTNVVELHNRQFVIIVLSATTFSFHDGLGAPLDGATITPFQAGVVLRVLVMSTPYGTAQLPDIRSVQTENKSVLLHPAVAPTVLTVTSQPTPTAFAKFSLGAIGFADGPYLDPVIGSSMSPSATTGTITLTQSGPLVNDGAGFTAADVGRVIRLFSEPPNWPGSGTGLAGDVVKSGGGYWIQQVNATTTPPGSIGNLVSPVQGEIFQAHNSFDSVAGISQATTTTPQWLPLTVAAAASWCWGPIVSVVSTTQVTVTMSRSLVSTAAIVTWRLGAYGGPNGYPTCGTYADGRLWLAGAISNRLDASNANDIFNFAPTLADGTVLDSHAIAATFNSDSTNPILWMQQDQQGILCGTQAGEWLVAASTSAGFSPTNIFARRVTKIGCANIEPRRTDHTLIVVQNFKREIVEYFADVFSGKFSAPDVTSTWKHLTIGNVQEIAYQQELHPIVWVRVNNGLVGCTYKRDTLTTSQGPNIAGGHRHVLGSGRIIESVAVGAATGGTIETLYMVTKDPASVVRHVEVFSNILDEGSTLQQAFYLDDAVRPTAILPSVATPPYGGLILTGLFHLNGKTVAAWIGGLDCGDYVVANGQITVPYGDGISVGPANGLFTPEWVAQFGSSAVVGFPFTSDGQIVRPNAPAETGARNGPAFGKKRRAHQYAVQLEGAQGVSFGTDFSQMEAAIFRTAGGDEISIGTQFTGIHVDSLNDDYSYDSMLCWRISRPYPCNVVAIGGFLETQDK